MSNEPTPCPDATVLLDLLTRQHELYRELGKLALAQHDMIAAEDPAGLLNLLSQRQKLIDQLADINALLEPARADWRRIEAMLTTEQRRQAQTLVEQVGQLLADILQTDEADSRTLSARKEMVARQIRATAASAQVQAAYRKSSGPVDREV